MYTCSICGMEVEKADRVYDFGRHMMATPMEGKINTLHVAVRTSIKLLTKKGRHVVDLPLTMCTRCGPILKKRIVGAMMRAALMGTMPSSPEFTECSICGGGGNGFIVEDGFGISGHVDVSLDDEQPARWECKYSISPSVRDLCMNCVHRITLEVASGTGK